MLTIDNIHKKYANTGLRALAGVSIRIERGDFLALLGPNGSGKTTLISIISGLQKPSSGQILYEGESILDAKSNFKKQMGLVPQEIALYPALTLQENMQYFGALYGLKGKILRNRANTCIEMVKLADFADAKIMTFSGGMKRRANLALSLIHEPSFFILDEPTVQVDPQSRQVIFEILKDLNQSGTTIIYTTHYMEEAEKLCNQVAILDHGRVLAKNSPSDIIMGVDGAKSMEEVFLHYTGHSLRDEYA